ncbi:MAG: periplasmic heavy metal sensor [Paracoccaceae bacterium]
MANAAETRNAPSGRWVKLALVLSLAVNLLVVGLVAGTGLNRLHDHDRHHPPGGELIDYGPYARALSPEGRDRLRAAFRARRPEFRANREALRAGFAELLAALRATPYDPGRAAAVLEAQQGRVEAQTALVRGLLLEHLAGLSDAERAAFADRLETVLRHGPPRPPRG